jgi:hypothetical protein
VLRALPRYVRCVTCVTTLRATCYVRYHVMCDVLRALPRYVRRVTCVTTLHATCVRHVTCVTTLCATCYVRYHVTCDADRHPVVDGITTLETKCAQGKQHVQRARISCSRPTCHHNASIYFQLFCTFKASDITNNNINYNKNAFKLNPVNYFNLQ